MGHDHHGAHAEHTNPHAVQEADSEPPSRIRSIELIKHNPNLFHVGLFDFGSGLEIAGGSGFLASVGAGAGFGWWYYAQRTRLNPATFYAHIALSFSRIFLGAVVGGTVGYLKFGDRQRLHNAWVAERLRRRYPDSLNLTTHDLWRFKGVKADQHYYRWT
jgi:hypothetical protein